MALYLVGENIDKHKSSYLMETGKTVQLMRGIYIDAGSDIEVELLKHAIRIAKYLYPRAYLAGASAILLAPSPDGRLFISGARSQRTRLRNLEIIQQPAPPSPSVASAIIADAMGEFRVDVSSIRQRFLESFRRRSELAAAIDPGMRTTIAARLLEEYGSPEKSADALWALARQNEWHWEAEQAERYLKKEPHTTTVKNEAALALIVAWHGTETGLLTHDGFEWRWQPSAGIQLPLIRQAVPGKLPPFISALLPEGWLETVLKTSDERVALRQGKRYMSNITIAATREELAKLPADILENRLEAYTNKGIFTGEYQGPSRDTIEAPFEKNLAQMFRSSETPRLSGVQIKAPMFLDAGGVLRSAEEQPFTHILKPAGTGGFENLPAIEWLSLHLAGAAGFELPAFALLQMPGGMPPALVVERFDIRHADNDQRMLALEDFCSMLDLPPSAKYDGTIEQAARALRSLSTAPGQDLITLFKRALFAWLIADGDMHLKNLALLKTALPGAPTFQSVRMTPVYDAVCTVVFPGLKHDRMAIKLNGKDNRIRKSDLMRLAATTGIKAADAADAMNEITKRLEEELPRAALPQGLNYPPGTDAVATEMITLCQNRLNDFNKAT